MVTIQEKAIFIADSHYPNHGIELLDLLRKIDNGEIITSQLFLMGDIFDLLVGGFKQSYRLNIEAIEMINSIANNIDTFYFEGNHDFQLKKIFPNTKIFSREQQPQFMKLNGSVVGLSHGDRYAAGWKHNLLSKLLRHPYMLSIIKLIRPKIISQKNMQLIQKDICQKIDNFEQKAEEIYKQYKGVSWVIEGHYHQAEMIEGYISLPSLACHKQIGVVRGATIEFVTLDELTNKTN